MSESPPREPVEGSPDEGAGPSQPDQYPAGLAALKDGDYERAIELLGNALHQRTSTHGDLSLEAAAVYFQLGRALLFQAQDTSDFLSGERAEAAAPGTLPADDMGKASVTKEETVSGSNQDAGDDGKDGDQSEEEGEDSGEASDLQLAWEHLEAAKVIWAKDGARNAERLAEVHSLLGDVGLENEDFEGALSDFQEAAEHLEAATLAQEPTIDQGIALARQRAEILYKQGMAWQFLDNAAEALSATRAAVEVLRGLETELAGMGEGRAREAADVAALQSDLAQKVEELQEAVREQASTKDMVKAALRQLTGGLPGQTLAPPTPSFPQPSSSSAPVQDLGTIGRGTKRIVLQPTQPGSGAGAAGAAGAAPPPAKKAARSLEDLMGPAGGETSSGF
ncbi:hypothetical protein ACKKBG_A01545 [Auxenochlorella protothecoides x Auxenochlorella symbiontica]